jgi:predicted phosphoadenosine phosphosulfate sulfurtransferase
LETENSELHPAIEQLFWLALNTEDVCISFSGCKSLQFLLAIHFILGAMGFRNTDIGLPRTTI